jgi:hypothetical protein
MDHVRYYEIAGITVQVESDLPFADDTFDPKFESFRVEGPGPDTVVIHHHFGLPEINPARDTPGRETSGDTGDAAGTGDDNAAARQIYRRPPWAIYRVGDSWVYHGIAPEPDDPTLHVVAVWNADYSRGDIYNTDIYRQAWRSGGLQSLTMFPTDQILLARLLADREACYLHSGGLTIDGKGFVFVGHSEAGKSTTMGLVRAKLGDRVEILCDDRNIVRRWPQGFRGGPAGFYVHGTWSHGDVPDVSSAGAPLRTILFLEQHTDNELVLLRDRKQVWQRLLATLIRPMATTDWWHSQMDLLERIVAEVPCYAMRFDRSGAIVDELERLP